MAIGKSSAPAAQNPKDDSIEALKQQYEETKNQIEEFMQK